MFEGNAVESASGHRLSGMSQPFECTWQDGGSEAAWVRIVGDLDLATAPQLQATLSEALDGARVLVIDLRDVTFMDSTGIYVLIDAQHKGQRESMSPRVRAWLCRPRPAV